MRPSDVTSMTNASTRHEFIKALESAIRYATSKSYTQPGTYEFGELDPVFESLTVCVNEIENCKIYSLPMNPMKSKSYIKENFVNGVLLIQIFVFIVIFIIFIIILHFRNLIIERFF